MKEPIDSNIEEAVRIQAKTGNIYLISFIWKGKYMNIKVFFPTVGRPSKEQVTDVLNKIYPGCMVQRYDFAPQQPGDLLLHVEENDL